MGKSCGVGEARLLIVGCAPTGGFTRAVRVLPMRILAVNRGTLPLCLVLSALLTHWKPLALAADSLDGSHSDSKRRSIVSRMWDRWLTQGVFFHLAFDLRRALMLFLVWMERKCGFTQTTVKCLFAGASCCFYHDRAGWSGRKLDHTVAWILLNLR